MKASVETNRVLDLARELGFDLAGIAPLRPPRGGQRFREWLGAGQHGEMRWLEKHAPSVLDPGRLLPEGRSLLALGLGHSRAAHGAPDGARIARYALGRDYHNVVGRRLQRLASALRSKGWLGEWRKVVDAGPLMERSHAAEAGLGFESKAANLLHPRFGPWFFLGELLLDVELEPTPLPPAGSCGTCTACIDACPTAAIVAPGRIDARLCISYHTIENRSAVPHDLRASLGPWMFGCDVCSEVCPWGHDAPDLAERFGLHPAVERFSLVDWLRLEPGRAAQELVGSPLQRSGRDGLARNAAHVLGNRPSEEGRAALVEALEDASGLVREASFDALLRAHRGEHGVEDALGRALARETDGGARAGMQASLDAL